MVHETSVRERFQQNAAPPTALLAVLAAVGVALLAGSTVLWPVETTDYTVDVDPEGVETAPGDAADVVASADLPSGARQAVSRQVANPDAGIDHHRASAREVRRLQSYEYVSYEGQTYAYDVENNHDTAAAFGRGALVGLGALLLTYAATASATGRIRPFTAATGTLLPVAVAAALGGAYGLDLLVGGPGNTLPTRYGGATYFLGLTALLFAGTLGARARVGFRWLLAGVFAVGFAFVTWEAASYVADGAPAYLWLVIALVAGIALVGVLSPVLGLGYLLATPPADTD